MHLDLPDGSGRLARVPTAVRKLPLWLHDILRLPQRDLLWHEERNPIPKPGCNCLWVGRGSVTGFYAVAHPEVDRVLAGFPSDHFRRLLRREGSQEVCHRTVPLDRDDGRPGR